MNVDVSYSGKVPLNPHSKVSTRLRVWTSWTLQAAGVSPGRATTFTPLTLPPMTLSKAAGIPFNPSAINSTLLGFNYRARQTLSSDHTETTYLD